MKIHIVTIAGDSLNQATIRLVKAHTKAGAERHVRDSIKPAITALVASQEALVSALQNGITIEDATASASQE